MEWLAGPSYEFPIADSFVFMQVFGHVFVPNGAMWRKGSPDMTITPVPPCIQ